MQQDRDEVYGAGDAGCARPGSEGPPMGRVHGDREQAAVMDICTKSVEHSWRRGIAGNC